MIKLDSPSCISSKIFKWLNTLPFKNVKDINTSTPQGCVKSTKSDSKNIYISKKCLKIYLSIQQSIFKKNVLQFRQKILVDTTF